MAAYEVDVHGVEAKVRGVFPTIGLGIITLGIYWIVWYFKINKEMKEFGRVYKDEELAESNPTNSVLAVTLGLLLIIPGLVSFYRTVGRIRKVQRISETEQTNGWLVLALYLVFSIVVPGLLQDGLNKVWTKFPPKQVGEGAGPPAALESKVSAEAPAPPAA